MNDIIIALLGGGAFVQLVNSFATMRQNRRRINADALGIEVGALEKTIEVLQNSFEREMERHKAETASLRAEIASLRAEIDTLRRKTASHIPNA
ncbi:MAG: hypothetical protein U0L83_03610 [Muribaculaceae bacterium]|nr:hypothetical protein [Muribaculaceae bacterium]